MTLPKEALESLKELMRIPLPAKFDKARRWYVELQQAAQALGEPWIWDEIEAYLGKHDLFYLLTVILRRPDAMRPWLFERCREVQAAPNDHLDLWAREHYKSTIITFALTIQDIIKDPDITVGIFSHTRPIAKAFLRQIKLEFEMNLRLQQLYPDIFYTAPEKQSPKWSEDDGIVVKRQGNPKEATVEAWGLVDGQPTGRHFKLRVYDDVVTDKSVTTPEQIQKTTAAWELSDNLGVNSDQGGAVRYIGTRYCTVADTPILMGDWTFKRIADVVAGDEVIGWSQRPEDGKRYLIKTSVQVVGSHPMQPVNRYSFDNGRSVTCTADHRWWRGAQWKSGAKDRRISNGREYSPLGGGYHDLKHIRELLIPTSPDSSREAAWLAGFFDGEGHVTNNGGGDRPSGVIVFTQSERNRILIDYAQECLTKLGFGFSVNRFKEEDNPVSHIVIEGGWRERQRFLAVIRPMRRAKIEASLFGQMMTERLKLTGIEDVGMADVHWLQTGTGNYVANGFCSANSLYDTYSTMLVRKVVTARLYPATHNGRFDGKPVFLSERVWKEKVQRQGRATVAAQLLQNPMADEGQSFMTHWLRAYEVRPRTLNVYIMADPSRGKTATSDNTAIAVVGIGSGGAKYLLDGMCHRMTLSERWRNLRGLYHRWSGMAGVQSINVGYERYGAQSDDEYFQEQMEIEYARTKDPRAYFPIEELAWPREGGNSKKERVDRLEPDFRNGRFYLPLSVLYKEQPSTWRVDADPASATFGIVEYQTGQGLTKAQLNMIEAGFPELICRPIIARDPLVASLRAGGGRYDVTIRFIEEYTLFPFGLHKDLIDATSRIYDMEPLPPIAPAARYGVDPKVYSDGF